jgi:hypothetical protein
MDPYLEPEQDPEQDPDPDPYLCLMDPDPGGPKTCGSGGSGSAALVASVKNLFLIVGKNKMSFLGLFYMG